MFREGISAGLGYERLLSIAYLFGAWGYWHLAEMYCDLALSEHEEAQKKNQDVPPSHEGLFFRALCLRKHEPSVKRYKEALEALKKAGKIKASSYGDETYEDPRFLKEQAALVFKWYENANDETAKGWNKGDVPSVEEARSLSKRALDLIQDDVWLKTQIYNNLCYHFSNEPDKASQSRAQEYYEKLMLEQKKIESDLAKWPPNYLDTVAWAQWILRKGPLREEEYQEITGYLKVALENADPLDKEREVFLRHLRQITEGYQQESMSS